MTLYGYARVSVREPEDKNLDLQVERLVRAGCSLGNIRAEEASGARNDRGGLLELLDLVVEGEPFGSVSDWLQEDAMVGLKVDDLELVEDCKVRECNLDISSRTLYIQLFVPFTAQKVRGWFMIS